MIRLIGNGASRLEARPFAATASWSPYTNAARPSKWLEFYHYLFSMKKTASSLPARAGITIASMFKQGRNAFKRGLKATDNPLSQVFEEIGSAGDADEAAECAMDASISPKLRAEYQQLEKAYGVKPLDGRSRVTLASSWYRGWSIEQCDSAMA